MTENPEPSAESDVPFQVINAVPIAQVVTRYGGVRHLAEVDTLTRATGRLFTRCRYVSAWTIESWRITPDHPMGLTPEQMLGLPLCEDCLASLPDNRVTPSGSGRTE